VEEDLVRTSCWDGRLCCKYMNAEQRARDVEKGRRLSSMRAGGGLCVVWMVPSAAERRGGSCGVEDWSLHGEGSLGVWQSTE
jgi:hypothetical protein